MRDVLRLGNLEGSPHMESLKIMFMGLFFSLSLVSWDLCVMSEALAVILDGNLKAASRQ